MKYLHSRNTILNRRYYPEISPFGGVTLGWERKDDTLQIAAAFCSDKDVFNKKLSHVICEGRIKKGKYISYPLNGQKPREFVYENKYRIISDLLALYNVSRN